jgi:hypothetical protein
MEKRLVQILDTNGVSLAVQVFLQQSSLAYQAGCDEKMLRLATSARQIATECDDAMGEAAAWFHLGLAHGLGRDYQTAGRAFERASRIFHRMPSWRQRWNEALALIGLGLVCKMEHPDKTVKAVTSFQKALDLLEGMHFNLAEGGDVRQVQLLDAICADVRKCIVSEAKQVVVPVN